MFTGIVRAIGRVRAAMLRDGDLELSIASGGLATAGWQVGDSIAVAGVCLTLVRVDAEGFAAIVSRETIAHTTLGTLAAGAAVNLEPALLAGDALGGHFVTGHVDGLARVEWLCEEAGSLRVGFQVPPALARYIAGKGSATVDGVSLTVNGVHGAVFDVNLIPHTRAVTTLGDLRVGTPVNLEVDILARYLERLFGEREQS
ncbi:MAG: riboflavin synthase [Gammaproteobacteria bacterium]|nr:riboflavin synthase [Gammaproteobacteria bacterium]